MLFLRFVTLFCRGLILYSSCEAQSLTHAILDESYFFYLWIFCGAPFISRNSLQLHSTIIERLWNNWMMTVIIHKCRLSFSRNEKFGSRIALITYTCTRKSCKGNYERRLNTQQPLDCNRKCLSISVVSLGRKKKIIIWLCVHGLSALLLEINVKTIWENALS